MKYAMPVYSFYTWHHQRCLASLIIFHILVGGAVRLSLRIACRVTLISATGPTVCPKPFASVAKWRTTSKPHWQVGTTFLMHSPVVMLYLP